ncbi:MAG TPA: hypothetical protein DCS93_25505 [Microscillaceae bacterium]|nr:hypothetical protein [Microscillaceae bacterium]
MNTLLIQNPDNLSIPDVTLDVKSGKCVISGNSYMEDACDFYQKILDWFTTFAQQYRRKMQWDFHLGYYNSSSKKGLTNIIKELSDYRCSGGQIIVNWYYFKDDLDMLEDVEDLMVYYQFKINVIAYAATYQETWLAKHKKTRTIV